MSAPALLPTVPRNPPAILKTKREREIWSEVITCPVRSMWFRSADLPFIARHVAKAARLEAMMKRRIPPTYETTTASGARIIRSNPEYKAMMQLDRDVRAEEQLLAGNPVARLTLETKTGEVRDPVRPSLAPPADRMTNLPRADAPDTAVQRVLPPAPASPIGLLKSTKVPPHGTH